MATVISGVDQVRARLGDELGVSAWHDVDQARIDAFATVTGDHQWIHVDAARAAATPFGGTIAHGYLTLSLGPMLLAEILEWRGFTHVLNYGLERVRFPAPVPVGSRVRMSAVLAGVDEVAGGVQVLIRQVFEREGGDKPVCVADSVSRLYAAQT